MSVEVRRTAGTDPVALELVAAMVAELDELYGTTGSPNTGVRPEELSPPHGGFVVLWEDGRPVAGGGLRALGEGVCEIKRMYVVPEARGRGLGLRLLAALETLGRDLGYAVAQLDTGPKQPHAWRMYERAGYEAVPPYNRNSSAAFWGEKALGGRAQR